MFVPRIKPSRFSLKTLCVDSPFNITTSRVMNSQQPPYLDAAIVLNRYPTQRSKEDIEVIKQETAGALDQKVNSMETSTRNVIRNFSSLW